MRVRFEHSHRGNYQQLRGLIDLAAFIPRDAVMCEIGSYDGDSAEIWAHKCSKLICVEPFAWPVAYNPRSPDEVFAVFKQKVLDRFDNIELMRMTADEAHKQIPDNSIDALYVDAFHSYEQCLADLQNYIPKVKVGGIIAGHDFSNPITPGVYRAVLKAIGRPEYTFDDWSFLSYKKESPK